MIAQLGKYSLTLSAARIVVEHYTGDPMGNTHIKQKILATKDIAHNQIELSTSRGRGRVSFHESSAENYRVELILPRLLFGRRIFSGPMSVAKTEEFFEELRTISK